MGARCARRFAAANQQKASQSPPPPTRIIVQRTPIHMDDGNPEFAKMSLDAAGFSPGDITVSVDDHVVCIKGERTNKLGDLFVIDRKFRLDKKTALVDGLKASFDGGILEIVVPKNSPVGPRTIPIEVTTSSTTTEPKETQHDDDNNETAEDVDADKADAVSVETVQDEDNNNKKADGDHEEEEEEQPEANDSNDVDVDVVATKQHEKPPKDDTQEDAWEEVAEE